MPRPHTEANTSAETDRIRRIYDERAASYDHSLGLVERMVVGPLRRQFGALLRGETLEIGVGTGLYLPFYTPAVTRARSTSGARSPTRTARCARRSMRSATAMTRASLPTSASWVA